MTYEELQYENKKIMARMETLTAMILAVELECGGYAYGIIGEAVKGGSLRADAMRKERARLKDEHNGNMEKLGVFLMTAERRNELYEMLKGIKA